MDTSSLIQITTISDDLAERGHFTIDDLAKLVVPVRRPVNCEIIFKTPFISNGARATVYVNGREAIRLGFAEEMGTKTVRCDLTKLLTQKVNELRCRCLVSRIHLTDKCEEGLLIINS